MKIERHILFACVVCVLSVGTVTAASEGSGAPTIIPHKINPNEGALTAGSTAAMAPPISYHGGPVMATPTAYLIWYGNWNQGNGSDTSAGQAIIRDFIYGLAGR